MPRGRVALTRTRTTCGATPPFAGGSEALWRETVAYREFAVVEYNASPVVPGRGSAIFLHDDVGGPTNGCVSLPQFSLAPLTPLAYQALVPTPTPRRSRT